MIVIAKVALVPDFRSSIGLFRSRHRPQKLPGKDLFDASFYKDDKSTAQFHDMVRSLAQRTQSANPSPFHHMLATMAQNKTAYYGCIHKILTASIPNCHH
jgi:NAD+-dependent protein deacetylase SIR2